MPRETECHHRTHAANLLSHYLRVAFNGQRWDADNESEVRELVDAIVDAAVAEIERRKERQP